MIEGIKTQCPHRLPMHILVMTRIMPSHSLGGMQKQTMDLCTGFVNAGHHVTVITTARNDGVVSEIIDGVDIRYLEGCKPGYYSRKWNSLCRKSVTQLHETKPVDVIHSQSMGAIGILGWARKNSIPIVSTWHGTSLTEISTFFASASYHPRYWHWLAIMPFRLLKRYFTMDLPVRLASSKITLVSPTLENNMKLFAKSKVITIPNGIQLPPLRIKRSTNPVHCIAIGRIEKEKGLHFAIRAIANLDRKTQENVMLNVVGEGSYLGDLKQLADDLSINNSVTFHGRIDDDKLSMIYQDARIHLMPTTRHEGLPLTILEGMAHSVATIASDIGGISGVINHGIDGILIEPGNQQQLNLELSKLLENHDQINLLGDCARTTIESKYTKQHMVNSTIRTITSVTKT